MKVGDKVVALTSLWIRGIRDMQALKGMTGTVVERDLADGFFDIEFPIGVATGCSRGYHVELEHIVNSPLMKALE